MIKLMLETTAVWINPDRIICIVERGVPRPHWGVVSCGALLAAVDNYSPF